MLVATPEGSVEILPAAPGQFRVSLTPADERLYISVSECDTSFAPEVILDLLQYSFVGLCDILCRLDSHGYAANVVRRQLLAYCDASAFRGKRILDFGCGHGGSTFCIATTFPDAEVVGVELDSKRVELARRVAAAMRLNNARFMTSPDANCLPPDIGAFDFVTLSAVYEHLLPGERRQLLPLIWSHMKPGAVLLINQTPYRYFPYEHHTTGLWLVNYLPDRICGWFGHHFSRINQNENKSRTWNDFLRGGIRGGTEAEVLRYLRLAENGKPEVMQPQECDRAAYWLSCTSPNRHRFTKRIVSEFFRLTDRYLGTVPSMNLDVAVRKVS